MVFIRELEPDELRDLNQMLSKIRVAGDRYLPGSGNARRTGG